MSGALIVVEIEGGLGSDVEVAAIPEGVLDDIRFCAHRNGRTLWAEILARLDGSSGGSAPPPTDGWSYPPLLSGSRLRLTHPQPPAAR